MKIFFSTDLLGGVWRYTVTLVHELHARGYECAVAVLGNATAEAKAELPEGVQVFSKDIPLEWMQGGIEHGREGTEWLSREARYWGADVIHLNHYTYAVGDFHAPVLVVAHNDMRSWFTDVRNKEAGSSWNDYTSAVREGMEAADLIVAPTAYQSGRLAQHYGRTAVMVIHNGMKMSFDLEDEIPASKREILMVAGRAWDEAKGIIVLDKALSEMGSDAPEVHFAGSLVGPQGQETKFSNLITHGQVDMDEMHRLYKSAKFYIGPSLYEPFGLSPLEAASHGCALLLSGIGSFKELWYGSAEFVEPLYPRLLASRIEDMLSRPERVDELGRLARRRAHSEYTVGRMASEYEGVYRALAARSN